MAVGKSGTISVLRRMLSRTYSMGPKKFEEWQIPVPWGQISGKWWGDKNIFPIVALHEFRQNAAAFDNLIPKLNVPSVLAVDLPGHGKSSPFPKGRNITIMEYLVALRHLTLQLPPGQLSFIAHGVSSYLAFVFSASYFKQVELLITIECGRHIITEVSTCRPNSWGEICDRFFEIEDSPVTTYTEQELLKKIKSTGRMSEEAAKILLGRSSEKDSDRLIFTNDPRNEIYIFSVLVDSDLLAAADNMICKIFEISNTADEKLSKYQPAEDAKSAALQPNLQQLIRRKGPEKVQKLYKESRGVLKRAARHLSVEHVETYQHILLDDSENTARLINSFYAKDFEEHRMF